MKYFLLSYDGFNDVWACDIKTTLNDFKGYEQVKQIRKEQIPLLHMLYDNLRVID